MKYVTVLTEALVAYPYKTINNKERKWKIPSYPLSEFILTCRTDEDSSVHFNLYVHGQPIPEMTIKVTKWDAYQTTHTKKRDVVSEEFEINGHEMIDWDYFIDGNSYFYDGVVGNGTFVITVWLKIEFSLPDAYQMLKISNSLPNSDECLPTVGELFDDPIVSDFKIKVGEHEFNVSKLILCISSPVFKANIYSGLKESKLNVMEIADFNAGVIKKMLQFVYNNKIVLEDDVELVEDLIMAVEKYQIDKLKARCESVLLNNITMPTAARYVVIADQCQSSTLRQECINFLSANYREFSQTLECEELYKNHTKITIEISINGR